MEALIPIIGGVVVVVVVLLILLLVLLRSYRIAAPNEALIITGRNAKASPTGDIDLESGSARVVIGGRAIVRPIVDRAFVLSLSSRQIPVEVEGYSMNGIFLRLRGVAQVKVGGNVEDVRKASQRFLDQQQQIDHYTQEILSGTLRAVVGTLTVEQIIRDRASFASQVQAEAEREHRGGGRAGRSDGLGKPLGRPGRRAGLTQPGCDHRHREPAERAEPRPGEDAADEAERQRDEEPPPAGREHEHARERDDRGDGARRLVVDRVGEGEEGHAPIIVSPRVVHQRS